MNVPVYKTLSANKTTINKGWVVIDATGGTVGRLASRIAFILRGKNKAYYTPNIDCSDHVIVINAEKVVFTGQKERKKRYIWYTSYPGGQKESSPATFREECPLMILEKAIKGMLPKNKLGRKLFKNLMLYKGSEHPHIAQKPAKLN